MLCVSQALFSLTPSINKTKASIIGQTDNPPKPYLSNCPKKTNNTEGDFLPPEIKTSEKSKLETTSRIRYTFQTHQNQNSAMIRKTTAITEERNPLANQSIRISPHTALILHIISGLRVFFTPRARDHPGPFLITYCTYAPHRSLCVRARGEVEEAGILPS